MFDRCSGMMRDETCALGSVDEMSGHQHGLSNLWDLLRAAHVQHLAVPLIRLGIRNIDDLTRESDKILASGISESDFQSLLQARAPALPAQMAARGDLPPVGSMARRASFTLALKAAQPNNRKRSLAELDQDVVARSSAPSQESRLRTFRSLAAAWEVAPFPLSVESIRCVAASLKAGGYRSSQLYFQAAINYQLRMLHETVHPLLRSLIRDMNRSIKRGLGPSQLKHGFDPFLITGLIDSNDSDPFDLNRVSHFIDVMIIGVWFMLREIEVANSLFHHLVLEGNELHLILPVHKTSTEGSFTTRILRCGCRSRLHRMCPWHCAERHLIRLANHPAFKFGGSFPLLPDHEGRVISKSRFIDLVRRVLGSSGIPLVYHDEAGNEFPRFGGHCLRVSGAMMLAAAGTPVSLIQLLGRWSSTAVERYVQQAPLAAVPSIPGNILGGVEDRSSEVSRAVPVPSPNTPSALATRQPRQAGTTTRDQRKEISGLVTKLSAMESEIKALSELIAKPRETLLVRHRSNIVHRASIDEQQNEPTTWHTSCGWYYGCKRFFRVSVISDTQRRCQKCFQLEHSGVESPEGGSDAEESDSSSSSSEDSELEVPVD